MEVTIGEMISDSAFCQGGLCCRSAGWPQVVCRWDSRPSLPWSLTSERRSGSRMQLERCTDSCLWGEMGFKKDNKAVTRGRIA